MVDGIKFNGTMKEGYLLSITIPHERAFQKEELTMSKARVGYMTGKQAWVFTQKATVLPIPFAGPDQNGQQKTEPFVGRAI